MRRRSRAPLPRKDALGPLISAGCVFLVLATLVAFGQWKDADSENSATLEAFYQPPSQQQQEWNRRFLQAVIEDGPDINDDITRDSTCKEYMSKFLNGTTGKLRM